MGLAVVMAAARVGAASVEGDVVHCEVEGCIGKAAPGRTRCWACLRYQLRTGRSRRPKLGVEQPQDPRERHFLAALELRDADSDDDHAYELAERRFWDTFREAARTLPGGELLALSAGRRRIRGR